MFYIFVNHSGNERREGAIWHGVRGTDIGSQRGGREGEEIDVGQ